MDRLTRAIAQVPAVPDDLDSASVEKVTGVVELPLHIRWSGPDRCYDLADRQQRAPVYEQVLREGNEDDVRRFIGVDELIDLWHALFCPAMCARHGQTGCSVTAVSRSSADATPGTSCRNRERASRGRGSL